MHIADFDGADVFGRRDVDSFKDLPVLCCHAVQKTILDGYADTDAILERKGPTEFESDADGDLHYLASVAPLGGVPGQETINGVIPKESSRGLDIREGSVDLNRNETASLHERHVENDVCLGSRIPPTAVLTSLTFRERPLIKMQHYPPTNWK